MNPSAALSQPGSAGLTCQLIVDSMAEGAAVIAPDGTILTVSPSLASLTGRPATSLTGAPAQDLVCAAARPAFGRLLTVPAGEQASGETELATAERALPARVRVSARDLGGELLRCLIVTDLTELRAQEARAAEAYQALQEQSAILDRAGSVAGLGWWIADPQPDGRVAASPEVYRILGRSAADTGGTAAGMWEAIYPGDAEGVQKLHAALLAGGPPYSTEVRVVRPDGSIRWVQHSAMAARDAAGAPTRVFGVVQDITERKQAAGTADQAPPARVLASAQALLAELGDRARELSPATRALAGESAGQLGDDGLGMLGRIQAAGERIAALAGQLQWPRPGADEPAQR